MSDHVLRLVPKDLHFWPEPAAARDAESLLRAFFPDSDHVQAKYFDAVSFIDAGENWEGVRCSACGADAEPWWNASMSTAAASAFSSLTARAPCCGSLIQLNQLNYVWPVAFGRFALEALNPNATDLSPDQLDRVSRTLGTSLLTVHARI